jgi:hypothetical protein
MELWKPKFQMYKFISDKQGKLEAWDGLVLFVEQK